MKQMLKEKEVATSPWVEIRPNHVEYDVTQAAQLVGFPMIGKYCILYM